MNRAARGIIFYIFFALYVFYNLVWIEGLGFTWNKSDTYIEAWFIGLCFVGDIVPLLIIPYRLRLGLLLSAAAIAASVSLGGLSHMLSIYTVLMWFGPKALLIAIAVWMERGRRVDYLA